MTSLDIAHQRLNTQGIASRSFKEPSDVVRWFGAVQAQDYFGAGGGILSPTMIINGRVVGTWRRIFKKDEVVIAMSPFTSLRKAERQAMATPAERFGNFLGRPVSFAV
jgi:hypothetical protein